MPSWAEVFDEIRARYRIYREQGLSEYESRSNAHSFFRSQYLQNLHQLTGRNIIAYYSGFLSQPDIYGVGINDADKHGFMAAVHGLDKSKGLDLILHTPGGDIAATQSIVHYLHQMFGDDIRTIVPQLAMSAGTVIACSSKSIVMGLHSNLGPIGPQLRGVPAVGILEEFNRAARDISQDPSRAELWKVIIGQYPPSFIGECENAINLSNSFVKEQLAYVMFKGQPDADSKANTITGNLSDYNKNKSHERHIEIQECEEMGLAIERLEDDKEFQDAVLSVHHSFAITLDNTEPYKIIENQIGIGYLWIPDPSSAYEPSQTSGISQK